MSRRADQAVLFAAHWGERLICMHGLQPCDAAALAGKRYAVNARDVLWHLPERTPIRWRQGLRARALRRPVRETPQKDEA